ncbi:DUF1080 domain-containing protein [Botrimarina sp.]|uniref:3-keto-disaccharide hydrolase n=1 Tax=Botrimarina sp. TaxID=2795802 RepID=UPI0032EB6617
MRRLAAIATRVLVVFLSLRAAGAFADEGASFDLFPGGSFDEWTLSGGGRPPGGWRWWTERGELHLAAPSGGRNSLLTRREFGDFDLAFSWRSPDRGNSGVKYRVRRFGHKWLGPEYQILDDAAFGSPRIAGAASLYLIYAPPDDRPLHPPGEWNAARIRVERCRVRHWLNGQPVVDGRIGSDAWRRRVARTKFADFPGWGTCEDGRLMLTDHGSEVWYRDLRLTLLPPGESPTAAPSRRPGPSGQPTP